MAIKKIKLTSTAWRAITSAGQRGTAWVFDNKNGPGGVMISHSNSGSAPTSKSGFKIWKPFDNTNIAVLGPDDANDVFYARILKAGQEIDICVDVI
jgi:hypothetical protein